MVEAKLVVIEAVDFCGVPKGMHLSEGKKRWHAKTFCIKLFWYIETKIIQHNQTKT